MPRSHVFVFAVLSSILIASTVQARKAAPPLAVPVTANVSKTDAPQTVTNLRPLVWNVSPGETFGVAIHWNRPDKPLGRAQYGDHRILATLESMTFHITDPTGKTHQLKAAVTDKRVDWRRHLRPLFRSATLFLNLDSKGFTESTGIIGKWANAGGFNTNRPGAYRLHISGTLFAPPLTEPEIKGNPQNVAFKSGEIQFYVKDKGLIRLTEINTIASRAAVRHLNLILPKHPGQTESAFTLGMVFADQRGNRVLHINGSLTKQFKWGYDLVRVVVTPDGKVIQVAHRGVNTCIAQGTMIETPSGARPVEELREGDQVMGFDFVKHRRLAVTVRTIRYGIAHETIRINKSLRVTRNHPIHANGDWILAGNLRQHQTMIGLDGNSVAIQTMRKEKGEVHVFDLTVDQTHNFFAGGFLVHNKDRDWHHSLDDAWYFYWPKTPHKWVVDIQE